MLLPWSHWGAEQAESWLKLWQYMASTKGNKDIWQYIHARRKIQNVFCGPTNILEVACVITIFKWLSLLTHAFTQYSLQTSYIYTYIIEKFCIWSNCYKLRHPNSCCFAGEGYVSVFPKDIFYVFQTKWDITRCGLEEEFLQLWLFTTLTVGFLALPIDVVMPGEKKKKIAHGNMNGIEGFALCLFSLFYSICDYWTLD